MLRVEGTQDPADVVSELVIDRGFALSPRDLWELMWLMSYRSW